MFYDKTTDRQAKYALRKKKNGGGAASFLIGTVVLGGLMLGGATSAQADSNPNPTQNNDGTEKTATADQTVNRNSSSAVLRPQSSGTQPSGPQSSGTNSSVNNPVTSSNFNGPINNESTSDAPASNELASNKTEKAVDATGSQNLQGQNQNANQKVTITNVTFNKDEIKESEGTDLKITFNWEATGLHKGDAMEIPMFKGFDSIYKNVVFPIKSDTNGKVGTLELDYNTHQIKANFTADLDPATIYSGKMTIGTFVSRDYFKELNNDATIQIPLPDGKSIEKQLQVNFNKPDDYLYLRAVNETMSSDKKQADVTWATLVNYSGSELKQPAIHLTTNSIDPLDPAHYQYSISPLHYPTSATLDRDSIKVYQARISPSLGYTKVQQLTPGIDYEIQAGDTDSYGQRVNNVWVVTLKGNYQTTNDQFVIEYDVNYVSSGDRSSNADKNIFHDALLTYQNGGKSNATVFTGVIDAVDSSMDLTGEEGITGSVDVKYITDQGAVLEATAPAKTTDGKDATNVKVGTNYTTEQKKFDGYVFVNMAPGSASREGEVEGTDDQLVVYVYSKAGSVDVKYITKDGKVLENVTPAKTADDQAATNVKVGTKYTTEEKSFDGYHFDGMDKSSDPAAGVVAEGTKHVIYVYEKDPEAPKTGSVDVKFVDKATGEMITGTSVETVKNGVPVGEGYFTTPKDLTQQGYQYVGVRDGSADPAGLVTEGTKHVVYEYEKVPAPIVGNVDVKYIDKATGKVIPGGELTDVKKNAPVGEGYFTEQKDFTAQGYRYVGLAEDSAAAAGLVTEGTHHVVYEYEKIKQGSVDVRYIDKATGQDITPGGEVTPVVTGNAGTAYGTQVKDFTAQGYRFVGMSETSAPADGTVEADKTLHVIYEYEQIKGSVDVIYVDEQGNPLPGGEKTAVKTDAPEGEAYTTPQKTFAGYTFSRMGLNSAATNGKVIGGQTLHVVYVYTKNPEALKTGSVDVKFVDKATGEMITGTSVETVKNGVPVGEGYFTTPKDLTQQGYQYVGVRDGSVDPAGLVTEGTKHVVYEYEKVPAPIVKKGSVDVKYIDRATGEVLPFDDAKLTVVKNNAPVGEGYNTDKRDFTGYTFVGMTEASAAADGTVEADKTLHVVYAYDKNPEVKKSNVDVTYVTEDGKTLKETELVFKDAQEVGTDYTTEQKEFTGYHFVRMGEFSADATGKVTENLQHVVYVYAADPVAKKGSVDVKYITKDGKVLEDVTSVKDNAPVGEDYTTEEKSFDGYHFVGMDKTSDPATGVVAEGTKHVIYVYEKDPVTPTPEVKKGNVDVTYLAEDGTVLKATADVVKGGEIGSNYETTKEEFDGYHFVRMGKFSADATGQIEEGTKHVVFIYAKNPETPVEKKGSVDVKYVTTDGKVLKDTTTVKDNVPVGEDYTTEEKTFDGYHFVGMDKTSDPATGVVAKGTKHVIYVYEKDVTPEAKRGTVTVEYVDNDGNPLPGGQQTTVKDNVPVGEDYTTEEKTFDGYHFVGMDKTSDSANGKVTEGTKHVIYVYEKDPVAQTGNVDVQYITYVDGKAVELPGGERTPLFTTDQAVDTPYTTNVRNFDNYHFVGMDQSSAAATGKVTNGVQHVIYVYEKNVTPTVQRGSVDVIYVDEHGNPLPGGELTTVKSNEPVGTSYTTTQRKFEGYTFTRMGTGSATPSGTVVPGVSHVIYVYTKDEPLPTPKPGIEGGTVTVTYVDEHGNPLPGGEETTVKDKAPVGETYTTTQRNFDGYHFTGMGEGSATPTGTVVPGTTRVIYVYTKDEPLPTPKPGIEGGTVTVTYVDEHGNPLPGGEETPVKDHAPVGETYTTTQRDFPGYTFTGMGEGSATPTGIVVPGTTRVVYVYTKTPTPTTETPTTPTTSTTPTPTASTPVAPAPVTPVAPSQPAAPASAKLPQTGNQANDSTAALGLAGLGLSALAALGLRKKKNS